jgi:hypothetical protein
MACLQAFSVPVEERRFREISEQQFGERGREQAKICADIMAKTGFVYGFWTDRRFCFYFAHSIANVTRVIDF